MQTLLVGGSTKITRDSLGPVCRSPENVLKWQKSLQVDEILRIKTVPVIKKTPKNKPNKKNQPYQKTKTEIQTTHTQNNVTLGAPSSPCFQTVRYF